MSYQDFIPHPSEFLRRDSVSSGEEGIAWWKWALFGTAFVAVVALLVWLIFFRVKTPAVVAGFARVANPLSWK